jgi:hypothetical protein
MKKLRIVGKGYKVLKIEDLTEFGTCDDTKQVISIRKGLQPEVKADTILHECIHAIDFQMHLEMSERQVHCIATGLIALFSDNPELARLILDTKDK